MKRIISFYSTTYKLIIESSEIIIFLRSNDQSKVGIRTIHLNPRKKNASSYLDSTTSLKKKGNKHLILFPKLYQASITMPLTLPSVSHSLTWHSYVFLIRVPEAIDPLSPVVSAIEHEPGPCLLEPGPDHCHEVEWEAGAHDHDISREGAQPQDCLQCQPHPLHHHSPARHHQFCKREGKRGVLMNRED